MGPQPGQTACTFVGIGSLGGPLALRALAAGCTLRVRDTAPARMRALAKAGATVARSLPEAVRDAEVVMICLPTPAVIEQVVCGPGGVTESMRPGALLVDFSTHSPATAGGVEKAMIAAGGGYLHVPVTGGPLATREGRAVFLAGGARKTYGRLAPLLEAMAGQVIYVGSVAEAATAKLVNNLLALVNTTLFMEGFAIAAKAGIPAQKMYDIIAVSPGFSRILERRWRQNIAPRNFEPGFAIDLAVKDLKLLQETADDLGVPMLTGAAGGQVYRLAKLAGLGGRDVSGLVEYFERISGAEIRAAEGPSDAGERSKEVGS